MAKKQLKGLTSSTTSLPKSVDSIIAEDAGAFGSPPFEDEGQASGAQSAAESLLNSISGGGNAPSSKGGSGTGLGGDSGSGSGSGSGAGSGSGSGLGGADGAGGTGGAGGAGADETPAPGSVEEGAQILADQTAAALSEAEIASPGEDLLDYGNGVLAYLANRLPMLGVAPCNFDPPGPPKPPPFVDSVVTSGTDTDADNLDDTTGEPITITTYPGGPYDPLRVLESTGLNIDQTMQLIMAEIYKLMTEGGGTTTIDGKEVPVAPPVPPPASPEGNIEPLSVPNLKSAAIPVVGKHFALGGEEFFECMTNIIKEAVEMAGGEVEEDPDPSNMPGIPLEPFVWVYAPLLAPSISGDALKCIEILGPFLRLAYLIPPLPAIPALPILLAALPLILDCCGFGPGNHENLDAVMAASPIVGVITIANVILGWVLLITGLALDVMTEIETKQMQGAPMLLSVPPIFPPPNPIFVSPSQLTNLSMLKSGFPMGFDKAVMAWAAAHVPPVDLRIGGIIPLVIPF